MLIEENWWRLQSKRNLLSRINMSEDLVIAQKLNFLLTSLGGNISNVAEAYAINNPSLIRMFEDGRKNITQKHQEAQHLFKKNDWKDALDYSRKLSFIRHLSKSVLETRKEFNDGSMVVDFHTFSFSFSFHFSFLTLQFKTNKQTNKQRQ